MPIFRPIFCLITILFTSVFVISCASPSRISPQNSRLTHANVKRLLKKGKTTQSQVLKALGSPNITTRNSKGEEVWTYTRQSSSSKSESAYGTLLFVGGSKAASSDSVKSFDLIITFDSRDVVRDYSVVTSQF